MLPPVTRRHRRVCGYVCAAGRRSSSGGPVPDPASGPRTLGAMSPHVLVLGGTTEARALAGELSARPGTRVTTSLAGRVRRPGVVAGELRVGGFGGAEGLADWLREQRVDAVVDATHPFAETITANAARAATATGLP